MMTVGLMPKKYEAARATMMVPMPMVPRPIPNPPKPSPRRSSTLSLSASSSRRMVTPQCWLPAALKGRRGAAEVPSSITMATLPSRSVGPVGEARPNGWRRRARASAGYQTGLSNIPLTRGGPYMAAYLADAVVMLHLAFIAFVVAGALLLFRWPRLAWIHLPAALWGLTVEWTGWLCPLTPLENALRAMAGARPYAGDFVMRYIAPLIYPQGLTRQTQWWLGGVVIAVNVAL